MLYFTITDPRSATYEIANPLQAIEQLTVTTLRNVIGGLTLEATLTGRENVNTELRVVLDEATGKWGIRINRVEIKSVDPPADIRTAMEKQMRAERDRRAAILTAEGEKQAADPDRGGREAGGRADRRGRAPGGDPARRGRSEGDRHGVHGDPRTANPTELLSYEYLQMLPQLAEGDANKVFVIPSEFTQAFAGIGDARPRARPSPPEKPGRRDLPTRRRERRVAGRGTPPARITGDVRLALREAAGNARRRARARHADRGGRRCGDAGDPPRAARGRRQLQGRQQFTATEGALPGRRCDRQLNPGQQVVKIVGEELTALMGGESAAQLLAARRRR